MEVKRSRKIGLAAGGLALAWILNGAPDSSLSPALQNKLASIAGHASDMRILGLTGVMRNLTSAELAEVVSRGDGYLPVLAIVAGRERSDASLHAAVRERFERTQPQPADIRFDPHAISPTAATFVACTEYLAGVEQASFLPELLQHAEVWAVPSWFVSTFRAMGAGWVQPVIERANQLDTRSRLAVLMTLVADGATASNFPTSATSFKAAATVRWSQALRVRSAFNSGLRRSDQESPDYRFTPTRLITRTRFI